MSKRLKLDALSKAAPRVRKGRASVSKSSADTETSRFFEVGEVKQEKDVVNDSNLENQENDDDDSKETIAQIKDEATAENSKASKKVEAKTAGAKSRNPMKKEQPSSWFPENWEQQLANIRKMRQNATAPVDEMGCHRCADESASGPVFRFQSLVALMLSSQTKDQLTYRIMKGLKEVNCTPRSIASFTDEELGKLIYPVSFWKRKVQYLKNTSKILIDKFNCDIPDNVKDLCSLPGVGPKMAHICMQVAWDQVSGIGVDTHVHRISNRLKWVPKPTKTPEETRLALESWLPKEYWVEVNQLLVGFGQEICQPVRPKCSDCSNRSICPFTGKKYQF